MDLTRDVFPAFGLQSGFRPIGAERWRSAFQVTDLIAASIGAAGRALVDLRAEIGLGRPDEEVGVDLRLASLWCKYSYEPIGWDKPPVWDSIAGDYETADGWIKLHTNAAHHRAAALKVLGVGEDRADVAPAVQCWRGADLETAIVGAGGVAAQMRSAEDWANHPQGRAVAGEPLVIWDDARKGETRSWQARRERPLAGLRVLDLTRILAGPVGTRSLAGFGAEVLRIDPVDWQEPSLAPDVTLGKHLARLDLRDAVGRDVFLRLLKGADVLVHGYRPGALDGLGLSEEIRRAAAPHVIEVQLDAYGWSGPWAGRRGYDSLVQMSSGIARAGMDWADADKPHPLPVQALDHATGYFVAAAVLSALRNAEKGQGLRNARLSLARTAQLLLGWPFEGPDHAELAPPREADFVDLVEQSDFGPLHRLRAPLEVAGAPMAWERPARDLGSDAPVWPTRA